MTTTLRFQAGVFTPVADMHAIPAWISAMLPLNPYYLCEIDGILSAAGATCIEHYGMGAQFLETWRLENTWLVRLIDDIDVTNIITGIIDFLLIQTWISPIATKIMGEDTYSWWREKLKL